jgi:hypothetical protein
MEQLNPEINDHIPHAHIELVYEDHYFTASETEVQGFIVQDPKIADFLSDIYHWATPADYLDEAKQQFNVAFARHHKAHIATTDYDHKLNRFCIKTYTF